nr:putative MPP complex alpha subunit Mas2 [Schizosaccharomyces pombe]O94745.2 RecName: Full=Probable mitochondrial-processing peptidase subunit alpha; AltName: Full=Alpha-MPP; AltName: Full=Inactive zinc metalloprotease alpha; Flags: Precursor [Schizosaccharomyces pombe 972h-]CAA22672.2 mitochondrial processing peptidase(MPP) complex alpha subunit Mas2 (predicted) [Schizosaccharomyces pombe]|eukprot:NP_595859.2 putative MPP complex alpha subunit Mas2 [Schizosaccharomyces pombe]
MSFLTTPKMLSEYQCLKNIGFSHKTVLKRRLFRKECTPALKSFYSTQDPALNEVRTEKLKNGVTYVCDPRPGHFSGLGVYVKAGSRYETKKFSGVSHFMDRLAFQATERTPVGEMKAKLENLGGNYMCSTSRESMIYQAAVFNDDVKSMSKLLAETVLAPKIQEDDLVHYRDSIIYENSELWTKPDALLGEFAHVTAFQNNTLGNCLLCTPDKVNGITATSIREYLKYFYRPEHLTLAYAGIPQEIAKEITKELYGHLPSSSLPPLEAIPSHYTGGFMGIKKSEAPPVPYQQEFTHVVIAMEGLPVTDPDIYALACLQFLLGGGGSFSAGGPGKGMYSRLYLNVLNQYPWVETCMAFNHSYTDSGLFGMFVTILDDAAHLAAPLIIRELCNTVLSVTSEETERAKNQLKSSLLMNLESRMISLEDLGRQIQTQNGLYITPKEMIEKIDALTPSDLSRVARRVLTGNVSNPGNGTGKPTVLIHGNVDEVGDVFALCKKAGIGH